MKNIWKRFLAPTLAAMLFLAACGTAPTGGSEAAAQGTDAGAPAQAGNGPLTKYDPPIEMNVVFGTSPVQFFPEGDSYEDNVWSRYMEETAGIILKPLWTADSASTDAFKNKMSVSLASGDLPDVFVAPDYQFFKTAVDAGYAADLTEIWNTYPSERVRESAADFELLFEGAKVDGKLMAIPQLQYYEQRAPFLWIRDDWLQAVGKQPPATLEEMVDIARAFTFEDPDGNGQDDTYGLIMQRDIFAFDFGNVNGVMSAFGVPTRADDQFFRDTDGQIKYAGILPAAKEALQVLQDMYGEGLIDPEFGVKDFAKLEEDINTSKVGMGYGAEWNCWYPYATIYKTDQATYKPYGIPAAEGKTRLIGSNFPIGQFIMVNSAYEHPEAMIKVRNFYSELLNEDSTDEIREVYNDKEQWRFIPFGFAPPSEMLWYPVFQEAIDNGNDESLVPKGWLYTFREVAGHMEDGSPDTQGRRWQCGPDGSISIIYNDYKPNDVYTVSPVSGERPESYINLMSSLNKIIVQSYTEIIMGADINQFDTFVESWLAAGGEQVLADLNAAYPA